MNEKTRQGIAALRGGDRAQARTLLTAALKENPNDAAAWLWLTGALDTDEERIHCLRQVLRIEPNNNAAARGLAQVLERANQAPRPETPPPPVSVFVDETAAPQEPEPQDAPPFTISPAREPVIPVFDAAGLDLDEPAEQEVPVEQEVPAVQEVPTEQEEPPVLPEPPAPWQALVPEEAPQPEEAELFPEDEDAGFAGITFREEAVTGASVVSEQPVVSSETPAPAPHHRRRSKADIEGPRLIFRTRPSVAPALGAFWLFLAGAGAVGILLRGDLALALTLAIGLGVVLNAIVVYALIRNMSARYELTNQHLTLRFRGKRVRMPLEALFSAEFRQSAFQRMLGTGDVIIEASAHGELTHLRMRNIPEVERRTTQLQEQIQQAKEEG